MIVKDLSVFKKYVPVNSLSNTTFLEGYIEEAEDTFLKKYIGEDLLDKVKLYDPNTPDEILDKLIVRIQPAIAFYSFYLATPALDVAITQSGFGVIEGGNLVPASKERVSNFEKSMFNNANAAIERLLKFLERNKDDYPEWVSSSEYFDHSRLFVRTAVEFNRIYEIGDSRLKFLELRSTMLNIELLQIEPAITEELAQELRSQSLTDTLTPDNKIIYDLVKRSIVFFAVNEPGFGDLYLTRAVNIILANQSKYPTASSLFPTARTVRRTAIDSEEFGFFVS